LLFIVIDDRNDTPLETNFIELDFSWPLIANGEIYFSILTVSKKKKKLSQS
jgi:hypothetical protein